MNQIYLLGIAFCAAIVFIKCLGDVVKEMYARTGNKNILRVAAVVYTLAAIVVGMSLIW